MRLHLVKGFASGPRASRGSRATSHIRGTALLLIGAVLVCLAGCSSFGGSDGAPAGTGPGTSTADPNAGSPYKGGPEVRILSPIGGQTITGSVVHVQFLVRGFKLVDKVGQPNVPGEGHLRIWLDDDDKTAPYVTQTSPTFDLTGIAPGLQHIVVELRQNDGSPLPGTPPTGEEDTPVHKHTHYEAVSALSRIQPEIFKPMCATAGCHVSGGSAPMALTDAQISHDALVNALADNGTARTANKMRVAPGRPDHSFLLQKLTRELQFGEGDPMPQNGTPLTKDQLDLIRLWISQGALPAS